MSAALRLIWEIDGVVEVVAGPARYRRLGPPKPPEPVIAHHRRGRKKD